MIKQIFLDLETTGTDPEKNGIYQIGGIIRYDNVYEEFELDCDIFQEDEVDPLAFEKTNVKPDDLRKYPDPYETYQRFMNILSKYIDKFNKKDKLFFINAGAEFDAKFLRKWFKSNGDSYFGSWFWHPPLDLFPLALEYLKDERSEMVNFKLSTVCEHCGIQVDKKKTHTALYDAKLAIALYDKMTTPENDIPF